MELWKRYFHIEKCTKVGQRFGFLLQTDGVSVCINQRKLKSKITTIENGFKYINEGDLGYKKPRKAYSKKSKSQVSVPQMEYVRLDIPDGARIIGIDPGANDIVTSS